MEPSTATSDPTHRANGSEYFTHDEDMINFGSIISGPEMFGSDPEDVGPFTDSFSTDRDLIWVKMVEIFQVSDDWTYLNPDKKHHDGRMGYNNNLEN